MKKLIQFSICAITFLLFSCSDPCDDVDCGTNGTCDDGTCLCSDGYEGMNCETETRAKYLGTYTGSFSECVEGLGIGAGLPTEFLVASGQVSADPSDINKVVLSIPNPLLMINDISIEAGGSFLIPAIIQSVDLGLPFPVSITVTGQGMFVDDNTIVVNLQIVTPISTVECEITMIK